MKSKRILLTYGWCRTAYAALRSLSRAGHTVFCCDASKYAMCRFSRYSNGFFQVNKPISRDYVLDISRICSEMQIDVLFPSHEDALFIQKFRTDLPENLIVLAPDYESLSHILDKGYITALAEKINVKTPHTYFPTSLEHAEKMFENIKYPCVIKTRRGNSGKGVFIVTQKSEGIACYTELVGKVGLSGGSLPIIQNYIDGFVAGSCFLAENGKILSLFQEKYLLCKGGNFGTSVFREPFVSHELERSTVEMVKALNYTGIGHFDFVVDCNSGTAYLIEMNPRMWGAIELAISNGYDFPQWLVELAFDRHFVPKAEMKQKQFKCLWVVGFGIAVVEALKRRQLRSTLRHSFELLRSFPLAFDDLNFDDLAAFSAECVDYGCRFLHSGGSTNPIDEGNLRSDQHDESI